MKNNSNRVRLAVQKSGRLSEESFSLLNGCGISTQSRKEQLFCHSDNFPLDLLLVRDDDIPSLVRENVCDFGIVGTNVLQEISLQRNGDGLENAIEIVRNLDFGVCRLAIAVPESFPYQGITSLDGCSIATSYPYLLADFAKKNNLNIEIVFLTGSVEIAPRLGIADIICDLVATGGTLEANNLREVEVIFASQAVLIKSTQKFSVEKQRSAEIFQNRIAGVQYANGSKYIMLHASKSAVADIVALLPGVECPTVMDLQGNTGKVAIHALCRESVFWETMEQLKAAGASSILVLPVEKMML